jgi:hypothetical protein
MTRAAMYGVAVLALVASTAACQRPVEVFADPALQPPEPVVLAAGVTAIPAGTEVMARLDREISTEVEPGTTFTMTLRTPVLDAQQRTIVPAGATIHGYVTAVRPSIDVATPAILRVDFQAMEIQGRNVPMSAEVVRTEIARRGAGAEQVLRGAVTGAAAGAAIGAVIGGDVTGALRGAAIGAGAGTIISLGISDQHAVLPEGSHMILRITEPVRFAA